MGGRVEEAGEEERKGGREDDDGEGDVEGEEGGILEGGEEDNLQSSFLIVKCLNEGNRSRFGGSACYNFNPNIALHIHYIIIIIIISST